MTTLSLLCQDSQSRNYDLTYLISCFFFFFLLKPDCQFLVLGFFLFFSSYKGNSCPIQNKISTILSYNSLPVNFDTSFLFSSSPTFRCTTWTLFLPFFFFTDNHIQAVQKGLIFPLQNTSKILLSSPIYMGECRFLILCLSSSTSFCPYQWIPSYLDFIINSLLQRSSSWFLGWVVLWHDLFVACL